MQNPVRNSAGKESKSLIAVLIYCSADLSVFLLLKNSEYNYHSVREHVFGLFRNRHTIKNYNIFLIMKYCLFGF